MSDITNINTISTNVNTISFNPASRINIFVFDMDETLGFFTEIFYFCSILENYYINHESYLFGYKYLTLHQETNTYTLSDNHFFDILNTFFLCIRPLMFTILLRIFLSKKTPHDKIVLYTNNQCAKIWCEKIVRFFEHHFRENYIIDETKSPSAKLFDNIIGAYMVNGIRIEKYRTKHEKCISDLIHCLGLPTTSSGTLSDKIKIFFMDDVSHAQMIHPNVTYILCKPYVYYYDYNYMIETYYNRFMKCIHDVYFLNNHFYKINFKNQMIHNLTLSGLNNVKKTNEEYSEDQLDSLKIIEYVKQFYLENDKKVHNTTSTIATPN